MNKSQHIKSVSDLITIGQTQTCVDARYYKMKCIFTDPPWEKFEGETRSLYGVIQVLTPAMAPAAVYRVVY